MPKETRPKKKCATCDAMSHPDFQQKNLAHAIELAHLAGMTIAVAMVGGQSVERARAAAQEWLCKEHASDLFQAARYLTDAAKKVN